MCILEKVHEDGRYTSRLPETRKRWQLEPARVFIYEDVSFLKLYDHTNYVRLGPVYLLDITTLQESVPEVFLVFVAGNYPKKRSADVFNQVSADRALEWLIGITWNETTRDIW